MRMHGPKKMLVLLQRERERERGWDVVLILCSVVTQWRSAIHIARVPYTLTCLTTTSPSLARNVADHVTRY